MNKTIDRNKCTEVGYIKKTHGVKGELLISFEEGLDDIIESLEYIFFEVEGLLVPFFIEEIAVRDNLSAAVLFDTLNNKEKAGQYVGCKLFVESNLLSGNIDNLNPVLIKGFSVYDSTLGLLGEIEEINDYGGNFVLSVTKGKKEILIPFNDDFLVSFNESERKIILHCPEGLIDLND